MADEVQIPGSRSDALLRVAAVGTSSSAIFHLEAAAIRDGLSPIVIAHANISDAAAEPVPGCPVCSIDELTERSDIDVVFVSGPVASRIEFAEALLQSRKHVAVDASSDMDRSHVQRLIQASSASQRYCSVWRPSDAEPGFRRAVKVVASGEVGPIRAVRLMQHDMAAALLPDAKLPPSRERIHHSTLRDLVGERIAQSLRLMGSSILSVSAVSNRDSVLFGTGESTQEVLPDVDTTMHVVLSCKNGGSIVLDLSLSCVAPVNTGWIVQGTQGGYYSERQYITVDDGEIYDVAVELAPCDLYQHLRDTIHGWDDVSVREECQNRLRMELDVADVLQQIR